jgi:glutathione synthase/RimK-type ligase-like ATP-grasp enzyme
MILHCGIPSEPPLARLARGLTDQGVDFRVFNQRRWQEVGLRLEITPAGLGGRLRIGGEDWDVAEFSGIYFRCMDDRLLPELAGEPAGSSVRSRCRTLHDAFLHWLEVMPARCINRPSAMASNGSKPYQAQLIREHGFLFPESLITNDPEAVRRFAAEHGRVIYKSMSGVRSIVAEMAEADWRRIGRIRWCPAQFQAFVDGTNVRVHVVGNEVFATAIESDATDYRYAERQGHRGSCLAAADLEDGLAQRCIELTAGLGLAFAGIDLKLASDGRVFCFEVNPSPGYSFYESHTGQPIADGVARYLAGEGTAAPA